MKNMSLLNGFLLLLILTGCKKEKDEPIPINNNPTSGSVTDAFGNTYATVKIGEQWWMTENLKTTKFQNGDDLLNAMGSWGESTQPAWCYHDDNSLHADRGMLYNWYAATDLRNLCPAEWRVASDTDWQTLVEYLGGELAAGHKLKSDLHWSPLDGGNTNSSGFNAYPAGYREALGAFYNLNSYAGYWSTTSFDADNSWHRYMVSTGSDVFRSYVSKKRGFSCRCVK